MSTTRERFKESWGSQWAGAIVAMAAAFAESEVRRALQPGEASPDLAEAEERLRTENARACEADTTRLGLALENELRRLRALLAAKNGEATRTAWTCANSAAEAVDVLTCQSVEEARAMALALGEENVYEVTLTARRVP